MAGHFVLGYALGASAAGVIGSAGGVGLIIVGASVLALVGALGLAFVRKSRRVAVEGGPAPGDWADAACPACLAVSIVQSRAE